MQTVVAEPEGVPTVTESVIPSTSIIAQKPGIKWPTERQAKLDPISEKLDQPRCNIPFSADIYNLIETDGKVIQPTV